MKQKMTYFAPETEQMEVKVESGFLGISTYTGSSVENAEYHDDYSWD